MATQLTSEQAIALAKTGWWKGQPAEVVVGFQLFQEKLCVDFSTFHEAIEEVLGRPVWTHEFSQVDRLREEYLGKRQAPTLREILDLIPEEKRIVLLVEEG